MTTRKLGNAGPEISPVVLGGNVFGWAIDDDTSFSVLDAAFEGGLNTIDTADMYSAWAPGHTGGESEIVIGKWIKSRNNRSQVVIATKVGKEMGSGGKGLSKSYILKAAEDSLRRLQTDYIDLYQSHDDDRSVSFQETFEAYQILIEQGKARTIGASNYTAERLSEAVEFCKSQNLPAYQTLQPEYNLCERAGYESALEGVCEKYELGVIPYFGLASGFLTGKYRSEADLTKSRIRGGGVKRYLNPKGFAILDALDAIAKNRSVSQAEAALAWLSARPSITAPIASATSAEQAKTLVRAADLALTSGEVAMLDKASAY